MPTGPGRFLLFHPPVFFLPILPSTQRLPAFLGFHPRFPSVVPSTSATSVTLLGRDRIIQVEFKGTHPSSVASARTGRGPGIPRQSELGPSNRSGRN